MSIGSSVGGVLSAVLGKGPVSAPDLTQLFETIKNAGANQRDLINALPDELKPLYSDYIASNQQAGQNLTTGTAAIADTLKKETEANYGPEATRAALDAAKSEIYADLPGQQAAIRQALAATGGFDRGTAGKQLAAPVLNAASKYATAALGITAEQLRAKQQATQDAINKVASMNDQALQSLFGMSKEQAMTILNGNRQDLKDQLSSLINQSVNETNQTLGVQGVDIQNKQNAAAAENAAYNAKVNAWTNLAGDVINEGPSQFNQAFSNIGALMGGGGGGGGGAADGGFSGGSTNPYATAAIQKGLIAAL